MGKANFMTSVKVQNPKTNKFDLSHDVKLSCNMGDLVPVMCTEVIPGDKWNIGADSLIRFAPLVSPMMHRCDVSIHYFFVPNRILWKNWDDYITNTKTGGVLPAHPYITVEASNYGPLHDYLGIPNPIATNQERVNALPYAAYQRIWNDYYRDENLQPDLQSQVDLLDGSNGNLELWQLRKRAWEHDYFTSCLPFAQKGDSVDIPMGDVVLDPDNVGNPGIIRRATDYNTPESGGVKSNSPDGYLYNPDNGELTVYDPNGSLKVNPATINDLRIATKLQEWLELAARAGTRINEFLKGFFGVNPPDARLQRPEYITGVKSPVVISEVLNTAGVGGLPQANMAGHAVSVNQGQYGSYYATEHGFIIGVMSVMPKTAYFQGLAKQWTKINSPFDYYFPQFAHIGEQEVLNKEVYAFQGVTGEDTFGYIPRYAEYRYESNRIAGQFRTTLAFWHMARKFATPPGLNAQFVACDPTFDVFADTDPNNDHLYCQVLNKVYVSRKVPVFGTPSTF